MRYKRIGYNLNVMRQSVYLFIFRLCFDSGIWLLIASSYSLLFYYFYYKVNGNYIKVYVCRYFAHLIHLAYMHHPNYIFDFLNGVSFGEVK